MAAIGKAYRWSEFQRDIQHHVQSNSGWQSAWWHEQQSIFQGHELATFCERLPTWLTQTRAKQYPLGAHDPDPAMTLMRTIRAYGVANQDDSGVYREATKASSTAIAPPVNPWQVSNLDGSGDQLNPAARPGARSSGYQ
jgi:hypothetical protein